MILGASAGHADPSDEMQASAEQKNKAKPQYSWEGREVPAAGNDEPRQEIASMAKADEYLRLGALGWKQAKNCVSCHTTGTYLLVRPQLTATLGRPLNEIRDLFVAELRDKELRYREHTLKTLDPAKVVYIAAGLVNWDKYVTAHASPETDQALSLMMALQLEAGNWANATCWPPLESDGFHVAAIAAIAVGSTKEWKNRIENADAIARLRHYLRTTLPAHDYSRTLLLWAATKLPDLLSAEEKAGLVEMIWRHQRPDGGWSLRTFAAPESWGSGIRAKKLRAEPDFGNFASDGHQTGLALIVLQESGIASSDPRIRQGIQWLKLNQRESGRWWTRSLNTDNYHFITYSGTAYPLLALALAGEPVAPDLP